MTDRLATLRELAAHWTARGENDPLGSASVVDAGSALTEALAEVDRLRAEVEMLRGVGCDEDGDGPCGVCIKCARRERDAVVTEAAAICDRLSAIHLQRAKETEEPAASFTAITIAGACRACATEIRDAPWRTPIDLHLVPTGRRSGMAQPRSGRKDGE